MDAYEYYNRLFATETEKAKAFDEIAIRYFKGNFGSMQKADFETLLFSLYIEKLLDVEGDKDFREYSDYRISKLLGITQSKVANLKVKKQLQYPRSYEWTESFSLLIENARYESGKIKVNVPDKNLFLEVKNFIEENNGYIDTQLNSKLLQVSPVDFIDLMMSISNGGEREKMQKNLREYVLKNSKLKDIKILEREPIGQQIRNLSLEALCNLLEATIPMAGKTVSGIIRRSMK